MGDVGDVADDGTFGGYCCANGLGRCSEHGLCGADGQCYCEMFWTGNRCQIIMIPAWILFLGLFVCCGGCATFCIVRHYDDIKWHLHANGVRLEDYLNRHAVAAKHAGVSSSQMDTGSPSNGDRASSSESSRRRTVHRKKTGKARFIPATAFQGPRRGYTFKAGKLGTGYYEDVEIGIVVDADDDTGDVAAPASAPLAGNVRRGRSRAVLSIEQQAPGGDLTSRSLEGTPRQEGDTESSTWVDGLGFGGHSTDRRGLGMPFEEHRSDAMGGIIEEEEEEEEQQEQQQQQQQQRQQEETKAGGAAAEGDEAPMDDVRAPEPAPARS
jgi:hypothetical protein